MSYLVEHKYTYDHKNYIYCRSLEKIQEEKNAHHYYKFHLYLKIMMVMMLKMNKSMWNHMYNIMRTMKRDKQGS